MLRTMLWNDGVTFNTMDPRQLYLRIYFIEKPKRIRQTCLFIGLHSIIYNLPCRHLHHNAMTSIFLTHIPISHISHSSTARFGNLCQIVALPEMKPFLFLWLQVWMGLYHTSKYLRGLPKVYSFGLQSQNRDFESSFLRFWIFSCY